jgi:hypothetical protein
VPSKVPLIGETWGGWGKEATRLFAAVSKANASTQGVAEDKAFTRLTQQLAASVQRSNARAVIARAAPVLRDLNRSSAQDGPMRELHILSEASSLNMWMPHLLGGSRVQCQKSRASLKSWK